MGPLEIDPLPCNISVDIAISLVLFVQPCIGETFSQQTSTNIEEEWVKVVTVMVVLLVATKVIIPSEERN